MQHSINLLIKAIEALKEQRVKSEEIYDNPELLSDMIFAQSDMETIDVQILSHQKAIKQLIAYEAPKCCHKGCNDPIYEMRFCFMHFMATEVQ